MSNLKDIKAYFEHNKTSLKIDLSEKFATKENGHYTGSCWIVNQDQTKTLLTHHKKLNIWIPTGGHLNSGETPLEAAIREGYEETGLKLKLHSKHIFYLAIHDIPKYLETPAHKHYDFTYMFTTSDNTDFIVSDESHSLKWVPLNQLEEYSKEDNVLFMRDKTLAINK
ncbi:MAG: hypothetical protein B6229_09805 [Spirochaetaceae bacterium 4572_7]|nr:MAG: hypothetical protein B6229_09805 [Spirochaetaceae bacterium 4572_7]